MTYLHGLDTVAFLFSSQRNKLQENFHAVYLFRQPTMMFSLLVGSTKLLRFNLFALAFQYHTIWIFEAFSEATLSRAIIDRHIRICVENRRIVGKGKDK